MSSGRLNGPLDSPKYRAALAREQLARSIAVHGLPTTVCGFTLEPLTLRRYSALRLASSPFVPPFETPTEAELVQFLFALSPDYTRDHGPGALLRFERRCREFRAPPRPWWPTRSAIMRWRKREAAALARRAELVHRCRDYVEEALLDRPRSGGRSTGPEWFSDEVSIIGLLAAAYSWSQKDILDLPLALIFQYTKEITATTCARFGQPILLGNPSDDVIQEMLAELNQPKTA